MKDERALDYWRHLPTAWDDTRVLQGDLGRRAVVARRKGGEWFVGAISPADGKFQIPLTFLESGKKFTARVYSDAADGKSVKIEEKPVNAGFTLDVDIPANGGLVARITPLTP